jgi:hypothetical protein
MEFAMSTKTKFAALALAALAATGSLASSPAHAGGGGGGGFHPGWAIGAGLLGAAVVGSAIAASNPYPYAYGYHRCGWVRQYDAFGNYMGVLRTCY